MSPNTLSAPPPTHTSGRLRRRHQLEDIRHLKLEDQKSIVREALKNGSEAVYLRQGYTRRSLAERLEGTRLWLIDLDGTTAHGDHMDERSLPYLRKLQEEDDVQFTALTGRPEDEMHALLKNHRNNPGFGDSLLEGGAYKFRNGKSEYFLSNPLIEERAHEKRGVMRSILTEVTRTRGLSWDVMGFGGHKSMGCWKLKLPNGERVRDIHLHQALMRDIRGLAQTQLEGVGILSSGTGTVEICVDESIRKDHAARRYAEEAGIPFSEIAGAGDSENDRAWMEMREDILKIGVVNDNTPDSILEHAHILTVGGNLAPILRFTYDTRMRSELIMY